MSNAIPLSAITGLVLAGGRGSRMGDVDKGLHPLRGRPLMEHVLERLAPQVGQMMINANRNVETYRSFGVPVYADGIDGFAGPLAGIHAGMSHCETPYMAVVPCDSPFLPLDLVQCLAARLVEQDADVAVTRTAEDGRFRWQSVFCLLKVSLLPSLSRYLDHAGRKVEFWQKAQKVVNVDFGDASAFINLNTPADWLESGKELKLAGI